jgi:defect-in-organelle-trafficking protein DotD
MNKKIITLIIASILLSACRGSSMALMKPPLNKPSDDASIKLAEAASSVSDSMLEMAQVEKVIYYSAKKPTLVNIPNAFNLQTRASIDWSGPIEELTSRISQAAHYHFRVLGRVPAIPVLISIQARDDSLAAILRNIDYQAGQKAFIRVYPHEQVVELRYA